MLHTNFNTHQPIMVVIDIAEWEWSTIKWWFAIPPRLTNVSALPGETWLRKLGLFSHAVYCICFGLLYLRHLSTNFDNSDNKVLVLLVQCVNIIFRLVIAGKHQFVNKVTVNVVSCVVLHHLLLSEQEPTYSVTCIFCNNW